MLHNFSAVFHKTYITDVALIGGMANCWRYPQPRQGEHDLPLRRGFCSVQRLSPSHIAYRNLYLCLHTMHIFFRRVELTSTWHCHAAADRKPFFFVISKILGDMWPACARVSPCSPQGVVGWETLGTRLTHFFKCDTFFKVWPKFFKRDPFFKVWPII